MSVEVEAAYRSVISAALRVGYETLRVGGGSLDAVEAAVVTFEDSPLFNAGKGACFTSSGINELDASLMDGRTRQAGAVAAVKCVKNPIRLARQVLEHSQHVLLVGDGAETFARDHALEIVPPDYFYTERRWQDVQRLKADGRCESILSEDWPEEESPPGASDDKLGTVGAVALDQAGDLAAGTSTGGTTNKRFGRVGDSPIIGAGTYANNQTCAVSATGQGEYFMRALAAYDISALMEYRGMSLEQAAHRVVMGKLTKEGGRGGVIAIDAQGNVALPFNTSGMYRGHVNAEGKMTVAIFDS